MKNRRSGHAGFTLIEMIVTVAILTLLAGVLVPAVGNYMEKSKKGKVATELKMMGDAFTSYKFDTGSWPGNADIPAVTTTNFAITGMPCLYTNALSKTGWQGPYLSKGTMVSGAMNVATAPAAGAAGAGLLDPWGNPYYCYTFANGYSGTSGGVVLLSRGPNNAANTTAANIFAGVPSGDDLVHVVSYNP